MQKKAKIRECSFHDQPVIELYSATTDPHNYKEVSSAANTFSIVLIRLPFHVSLMCGSSFQSLDRNYIPPCSQALVPPKVFSKPTMKISTSATTFHTADITTRSDCSTWSLVSSSIHGAKRSESGISALWVWNRGTDPCWEVEDSQTLDTYQSVNRNDIPSSREALVPTKVFSKPAMQIPTSTTTFAAADITTGSDCSTWSLVSSSVHRAERSESGVSALWVWNRGTDPCWEEENSQTLDTCQSVNRNDIPSSREALLPTKVFSKPAMQIPTSTTTFATTDITTGSDCSTWSLVASSVYGAEKSESGVSALWGWNRGTAPSWEEEDSQTLDTYQSVDTSLSLEMDSIPPSREALVPTEIFSKPALKVSTSTTTFATADITTISDCSTWSSVSSSINGADRSESGNSVLRVWNRGTDPSWEEEDSQTLDTNQLVDTSLSLEMDSMIQELRSKLDQAKRFWHTHLETTDKLLRETLKLRLDVRKHLRESERAKKATKKKLKSKAARVAKQAFHDPVQGDSQSRTTEESYSSVRTNAMLQDIESQHRQETRENMRIAQTSGCCSSSPRIEKRLREYRSRVKKQPRPSIFREIQPSKESRETKRWGKNEKGPSMHKAVKEDILPVKRLTKATNKKLKSKPARAVKQAFRDPVQADSQSRTIEESHSSVRTNAKLQDIESQHRQETTENMGNAQTSGSCSSSPRTKKRLREDRSSGKKQQRPSMLREIQPSKELRETKRRGKNEKGPSMHKAVKEDIVPVKDRFGNQDPPGTRIVFVEKKRSKPKKRSTLRSSCPVLQSTRSRTKKASKQQRLSC
jgi:hypothetical protein